MITYRSLQSHTNDQNTRSAWRTEKSRHRFFFFCFRLRNISIRHQSIYKNLYILLCALLYDYYIGIGNQLNSTELNEKKSTTDSNKSIKKRFNSFSSELHHTDRIVHDIVDTWICLYFFLLILSNTGAARRQPASESEKVHCTLKYIYLWPECAQIFQKCSKCSILVKNLSCSIIWK
jgi:hypothetical protein